MAVVEAQAAGLPVMAADSVPRESIVVPELVKFLPIKLGDRQWAAEVLRTIAEVRRVPDANERVAVSAFSIRHSAVALLQLYQHGILN